MKFDSFQRPLRCFATGASRFRGLIPHHPLVPVPGMHHLTPTSGPCPVPFPSLRPLLTFAVYLADFCSSSASRSVCPSLWAASLDSLSQARSPFHVTPTDTRHPKSHRVHAPVESTPLPTARQAPSSATVSGSGPGIEPALDTSLIN